MGPFQELLPPEPVEHEQDHLRGVPHRLGEPVGRLVVPVVQHGAYQAGETGTPVRREHGARSR